MQSDAKTHWEKAWSERQVESVSWHQEVPELSLSMIRRSGPGPDGGLLDVGGGASLLVDHLLADGFSDITVLDISAAALAQAKRRLGALAGRVSWVEADITTFKPDRRYRFWHDRAAFHFLTSAGDRERYVEVLYKALLPGGQAVIASFAPGGPKKCSGLDIVQYDADAMQQVLGAGMALREECRENHRTPAGAEQKFAFFRFERVD